MAPCQTLSVAFDESLRFSFLAISPYPRLAEEPAPGSVNGFMRVTWLPDRGHGPGHGFLTVFETPER